MRAPNLVSSLIESGALFDVGAPGVYVQGGTFARLIELVDACVLGLEPTSSFERFVGPPQMPAEFARMHRYDVNFPDLLARVETAGPCGCGGGPGAAGDADALVLVPAVCSPLYPILARRPAPQGLFTIRGQVFRSEPSRDSGRWQSFQVRDWVCVGSQKTVDRFCEDWLRRWEAFCRTIGIEGAVSMASDPFTGPSARVMRSHQEQKAAKLELRLPLDRCDCAVSSINKHETHFSTPWGMRLPGGALASSACVGFGLERIALALIDRFGLEPAVAQLSTPTHVEREEVP